MKKWLIAIYFILIIIGFSNKEIVLQWIQTSHSAQIPLMIVLSTILSIFPVVPFSVFAGLMGAKYGLMVGACINWFGSAIAAFIMFIGIRYLFAEQGRIYIKRFKALATFHQLVERNPFAAVLFARLLPIIPPPIINIYSAIGHMSVGIFMSATIIGKLPGMLVFAYVGDRLFTSFHQLLKGLLIYGVFLLVIVVIYRLWVKGVQMKRLKT